MAFAALLAAGCGGGSDATPSSDGAESGDTPPQLKLAGSGPDPALAQERLLANANMSVPGAASIVSYTETGVQYDGPPEMQSAIVNYEAELEFSADTYFHKDHKAGERAKVYGEAEYLNEGGTWRLIQMGIYPK
ncbi:MAG: hypothetical protein ACT4UP_06910 [Gammaproteobacteria bacterium]